MHARFCTSYRVNHGASPKESSDPQRKKIPCLSKEAPHPLKFINSFLCDFFFFFFELRIHWRNIFSVAFLWEVMNRAIREEQMARGRLCRSQRAVVTVQIKMVTVILATERSLTYECTWNPHLHMAFSLRFILINGVVLIVRDSTPLVGLML